MNVEFAAPSDNHWSLALDQVFDSTLAQLAQDHLDREATAAQASLEEGPATSTHHGKKLPPK